MDTEPTLQIKGNRLAFIGIGGGSDGIQAAVMALMSGKPSCMISIRRAKTESGVIGEQRFVTNHGGEIMKDVFRMTSETQGSGRFLEFIPADKLPTYLVIETRDGTTPDKIKAALEDFGQVDTVIACDTGGDCLYRSSVDNAEVATPDQDIESLQAVGKLSNINIFSCVIANGIDSPPYADEVLVQAKASFFDFNKVEKEQILQLYKEFDLMGDNPKRYGKTPFAWQAALMGKQGNVRIPLPETVVNDPINPWNPNITITKKMSGFYLMNVKNHLKAIGA